MGQFCLNSQIAFIGRQILDATLVANEFVDGARENVEGVVFKLDF